MAQAMTADRSAVSAQGRSLKDWSGWDYVPGIAFLAVGILALVEAPIASLATGIYLGAMLCVAGGFMLAGGIATISHKGAWLGITLGLLSLLAGVTVLYNPIAGAVSLVWVIGAWFILGGVFEVAMGLRVQVGRGWLLLVGIVNIGLGAFVVMMQPIQAFTFLGYLVGISLICRGLWSLMFTTELHAAGLPAI